MGNCHQHPHSSLGLGYSPSRPLKSSFAAPGMHRQYSTLTLWFSDRCGGGIQECKESTL